MIPEPLIFQAAALAAHSNSQGQGFRQKDLKFMAELMANWMDAMWPSGQDRWHNTQVMRFLNSYAEQGLARKTKQSPPTYRLTRGGLVEICAALSAGPFPLSPSAFCFLHYFLKAYAQRVLQMIAHEGSGYSKTLQLEVESHLDVKTLVANQKKALKYAIQRLQVRQKETRDTALLARKLHGQDYTVDQIVSEASHLYPYDLNNQKPMEELFREIPPELRLWELMEGNEFRAEVLWTQEIEILQSFLKSLP